MKKLLVLLAVLALAAPAMAWRPATDSGGTNSSQAIMRCTYSRSMSNGASRRIEPCTHSVPRCR